jgi:hypothetical protein
MDAQESVGEDPALQKSSKLSLDETRRRAIAGAGPCEKCLEVFADHLVKDSLVWAAGSVGGRGEASGSDGGFEGPRRGAETMLAR